MAPKFTLSILCCNRLDLTRACLLSVARHSHDYEVIVTDNGSSDGTAGFLQGYAAKSGGRVRVVRNKTNMGFKEPNNHALTLARGEFFVLLNDDVTVCEGWLEKLASPFLADARMAITGIRGTCDRWDKNLRAIGGEPAGAEYIEGSCLMTPTALARKHGLFPAYLDFIYWEDGAYSLRMRELGYRIATVEVAINHEKRSQTVRKVLTPERIAALLKHNTEAMQREWGWYFKRRDLRKRILVRRLGAHGDVLLTTPALRAFRDEHPLADIHVLTKCPNMLHGLDWLSVATRPRNWYDDFVDLDLAYEKRPEVHVTQAFADVLGVKLSARWQMHMKAGEVEEAWAERTSRGMKLAVVHPGLSSWPGKNWGTDRFADLVRWLQKRDYLVASVGDKVTPEVGADLNLAGRTTPQQLYALCKRARLFVGIDSMCQHVASAADTPSVVLFGPTNPRALVRPTHRIVAVQADVTKVPCVGEHGRRTKPVTQAPCEGECMRAITLEMAQGAVERVERLTQ